MKDRTTLFLAEKVTLTQLTREFSSEFMKYSYFMSARQRGDVLNHGLRYRILKSVELIPRATRLVAYHTEEKTAIGFLYLEENTDWLYTIEYVFVDPKYRKMGLATKLINYAIMLARQKGARKVNLNVGANSSKVIDLYRKLGFEKVGATLLIQGYISGSAPSRLIKRAVAGQGFLTRFSLEKRGQFLTLKTNLKKNRETLIGICQRTVDQCWMKFFEINTSNVVNGSRHVWQPPFFRQILINDIANSYALIFNTPLSSKATVELYCTSQANVSSILEEILKILKNRGVSFTQITLFNLGNIASSEWFEEKGMMTFQFVAMGKTL